METVNQARKRIFLEKKKPANLRPTSEEPPASLSAGLFGRTTVAILSSEPLQQVTARRPAD